MIYYDKVTKLYNGSESPAVVDITLRIEPSEFVSIVGGTRARARRRSSKAFAESPNRPRVGSLRLAGNRRPFGAGTPEAPPQYRHGIPDFQLLPTKTVYENIAFALGSRPVRRKHRSRRAPRARNSSVFSTRCWTFPPGSPAASGSVFAIARAIVNQPDVLIADGPTGNLDPVNAHDVVQICEKKSMTSARRSPHDAQQIGRRLYRAAGRDHRIKGASSRDDKQRKYVL